MIESSKNEFVEPMKKLLQYNRRDIINEVCEEFENRGNFIRIFPMKNSNIYDKFFTGQRPMNQMIFQALYDPGIYNGPKATVKRPQSAIVTKNTIVG
jgi:hypothetical protein